MGNFVINQPRHRRRRQKIIIPAIILIILIGLVGLTIHSLSSPAVGSIAQGPASQAEKIDPYAKSGHYIGKYISFSYPAHFKSYPSKLTGDILETVSYSSTDQTSKQINLGVYKGSLSGDSGITYRQQHPELYKQNTSRLGIEFTKLDGTEDTFFIQHKDLVASVSATAPYANLYGEAEYVASSLGWQ
jgi:hypothetical protein